MGTQWFVCSARADYTIARQEIAARDGNPKLLWVDELGVLLDLVSSFGNPGVSVAVVCREQPLDELESAIALIGEAPAVTHVLAIVTELDPACIARLFRAGATEVIAAESVTRGGGVRAVNERMDVGSRPVSAVPPVADDISSRMPNETTGFASQKETVHDRAFRDAPESDGGDVLPPSAWEPPASASVRAAPVSDSAARAPVVCALAGRGGCGKSTLVASMGSVAARLGLRTAVIDLDLMFGNLYELLGAEVPADMASLVEASAKGYLTEPDLLGCAMRVGPGITLWGPVAAPESAELMARPVELLIETLRRESDVVFVDTSSFWGDAVAAAVAASDRCLIVGDHRTSGASSAQRAIELATRVGVPRTSMTSVLNRFGARGCDEEVGMRFEMTCALGSKARIADGGAEVASLLAFGRADELVGQEGAYAESVQAFTRELLAELGCTVGEWPVRESPGRRPQTRGGIRLPWKKGVGER